MSTGDFGKAATLIRVRAALKVLLAAIIVAEPGFLVSVASAAGVAVNTEPAGSGAADPSPVQRLKMHLSWGHRSPAATPFYLSFSTNEVAVTDLKPVSFETGDSLQAQVCETRAGAGDVDGVELTLAFPKRNVGEMDNLQRIWAYLFAHSDDDTARRLRQDPGYRPDRRQLTVRMDRKGTRGFSVTMDQLLRNNAFWVPELDVYLSAGDIPVSFDEHQHALESWGQRRVIQQIENEPEATYEHYTARWEDMGNPAYTNPAAVTPGHIVCVTWDSAIPKFGIDRGAGVWNDYGNPDHFHFGFDFGELSSNLTVSWKGQKLANGLPVLTTTIERAGVRYEVEQFAYPLHGPPAERKGDIDMVLLQKVRLTELQGAPQVLLLGLNLYRELAPGANVLVVTNGASFLWQEASSGRLLLSVEAPAFTLQSNIGSGTSWKTNRIILRTSLAPGGAQEFVIKLPSPLAAAADRQAFLALDYTAARDGALRFWSDFLARGAQFEVPEDAVNELFRANLWHALRLPRRHGGEGANVRIDLPYSNFAYDQHGTPWPVNQSVYVDYMLYDLRGYHSISAEELATMFANNQEPNGHIGGFANWGVYTPGMMYSVAQHYLLSGDRPSLEQLLPQTLKSLDWGLGEMRRAAGRSGAGRGLALAPLNDLSHDLRAWAFNQAYLYAGTQLLGRVLAELRDPRAEECLSAARQLRDAIQTEFARASMQSPLVQLRDHTWMPYVPSDALASGRLLDVWYPTDVDCGALHLSRLEALDPNGPLTTWLLNDHEDNLFLKEWGMANEPVYNPQATAYLLRDEVKPAIRAFYSMMACAFSHSVFEPVEHRWCWGQYFGPPSTDGAWFELYRRMLIHERDDNTLLLCQATPRKWLEDGKQIHIRRAPTYYGRLDLNLNSRAATGEISASIDLEQRKRPAALLIRLRHPLGLPIQSVTLNRRRWTDFDAAKEWVRISNPSESHYEIAVRYP